MPPKAQEGREKDLLFLWTCIKNSDFKSSQIDFDGVATSLDIKKGAASKRFSRLKTALDGLGAIEVSPSKGTKRKSEEPGVVGADGDKDEGKAKKKPKQVKGKSSNAKGASGATVKKEAVSGDEQEVGERSEEEVDGDDDDD